VYDTILLMSKNKVVVYIDGGNTYRGLKAIGIPDKDKKFNYSSFVTHVLGDRQLTSKRYYIGVVKNFDNSKKSQKMERSQQKFLSALESEGFDIKRGRLMYDSGNIREKGVDVKLSIDLVVGAVDNLYDTAIVISSDTDIIPAIQYVQKALGKKVEYVGFSERPSFGMLRQSTTGRIFSKEDLKNFQKE